MGRFAGKVIAITGAGSGLGRDSALEWAREGASVVVSDLIDSRAQDVNDEIAKNGGDAVAIKADVRSETEVEAMVQLAVSHYGHLDVMFANAGRSLQPRSGGGLVALEDVTQEQWDDLIDVLVRGVFFCGKHACRVMKGQGRGNIIVTVSATAEHAYPGVNVYGTGKTALLGLIRGMALDWGRYGIRVNGLSPTHGMSVNFALPSEADVVGMSYEEYEVQRSGNPWDPIKHFPGPLKVNRPPSLRDNLAVATFLACDDSEYLSGITIPSCDGGSSVVSSMVFPDDWSLEDQVK